MLCHPRFISFIFTSVRVLCLDTNPGTARERSPVCAWSRSYLRVLTHKSECKTLDQRWLNVTLTYI